MMQVRVKLVSRFAEYAERLQNGTMVLAADTTPGGLAKKIGLPADKIGIIAVNGKQGSLNSSLKDGDEVLFLPPAAGGG